MACPSTVLHSQRLPALKSIIPSYCEETCRLLLETLNAHQAATKRPINPENDIKNLEQLGASNYILQLIMEAEKPLRWPSESTLTLQQRVERIQAYYGLKECPQHERPDLTASQALIQLQHSESLSADYENWSPDESLDEPPLHALFFASRAFGGLCCKLPPDMSHEDPCLPLLIPLCNWHDRHLKDTMKNQYKQDIEDLSLTYASIPFKRPAKPALRGTSLVRPSLRNSTLTRRQMNRIGCSNVSSMIVEARPRETTESQACQLQDVLNRICCEVNGRRVIGLATYE